MGMCHSCGEADDDNTNGDDEDSDTYDPKSLSGGDEDRKTMEDFEFFQPAVSTRTGSIDHTPLHTKKNHSSMQSLMADLSLIPYPRKRVIFISLSLLNASIDEIPDYILEDSIYCFRTNRSNFFPSTPSELKAAEQSIAGAMVKNRKFSEYLKKKDRKGLILWLSERKTWKHISHELTKMTDIYATNSVCNPDDDPDVVVSKEDAIPLKPLILDQSWWLHTFRNQTGVEKRFNTNCDSVVAEILSAKGKYLPTMELLYQSNSNLIPMRAFDFEAYLAFHDDSTTDTAKNSNSNSNNLSNNGEVKEAENDASISHSGSIELRFSDDFDVKKDPNSRSTTAVTTEETENVDPDHDQETESKSNTTDETLAMVGNDGSNEPKVAKRKPKN